MSFAIGLIVGLSVGASLGALFMAFIFAGKFSDLQDKADAAEAARCQQ